MKGHTWVISPREKSNTSSLSNFRMIMLFSHSVSLVLDAPTMSGMKLCHLCGHSCLSTCAAKQVIYKLYRTPIHRLLIILEASK